MVPVNPADKILSPALEGFARPACAHQRAICRLGCVLDSPKGVPGRPSWDLQDLEGIHSAPTEGMPMCMCRVVHKRIRLHESARIRSSIWEVARVRPPLPLPCRPHHRLSLPPGWHGSHPVHSSLSMQAFHGWDGSLKTVYPQLSEDPLGLFGRSEPTEFGRWVQWTSVLMAGVLGGGF